MKKKSGTVVFSTSRSALVWKTGFGLSPHDDPSRAELSDANDVILQAEQLEMPHQRISGADDVRLNALSSARKVVGVASLALLSRAVRREHSASISAQPKWWKKDTCCCLSS